MTAVATGVLLLFLFFFPLSLCFCFLSTVLCFCCRIARVLIVTYLIRVVSHLASPRLICSFLISSSLIRIIRLLLTYYSYSYSYSYQGHCP